MSPRWLLALSLVVATGAACADRPSPRPVTPSNGAAATTPTRSSTTVAALLGPDGTHFAAERVYEGQCAPAGSRGGCVTITLRPDGTYRHVHYDMVLDGTYTVTGTTVALSGAVPGEGEELTLAPDGSTLGELPLKR